MRPASFVVVASLAAGLAGCAEADSGIDAMMRVDGAQFVVGAMPEGSAGPEVTSVILSTNVIRAGQIGKPLQGTVAETATGVAIGLSGDSGYWLVPAGVPNIQEPDLPTYDVSLSFAPSLPDGKYELTVRAADASDRLGPPSTAPLTTTSPLDDGALVISLRWDTESDLDLHVVDPNGVEIFKRDISSYQLPPPGTPPDPAALEKAGLLDFDSNAECVIDGRREENVIWKKEPPAGHYLARVDTFSLCGTIGAHWNIEARRFGVPIAQAQGTSTDLDAAQPHDRGAGVLALEFDLH